MPQDCGTEVNAASAAAKAIGCSSTEVRTRRDKKNRSDGKASVRRSGGLPLAELQHTEKFSALKRGASGCQPRLREATGSAAASTARCRKRLRWGSFMLRAPRASA